MQSRFGHCISPLKYIDTSVQDTNTTRIFKQSNRPKHGASMFRTIAPRNKMDHFARCLRATNRSGVDAPRIKYYAYLKFPNAFPNYLVSTIINQTQTLNVYCIVLYLVYIGRHQSKRLFPKTCLKLLPARRLNPFLSGPLLRNTGALMDSVRNKNKVYQMKEKIQRRKSLRQKRQTQGRRKIFLSVGKE